MKIVLFDLNNTIINDWRIWWEAVRETFRVFGKKAPSVRQYIEELKKGDFIEIYRSRGIDASRENLNEIYEKSYETKIQNIVLFPNVKETLQFLHGRKVIMGIVTGQKKYLVSPFLDRFQIGSFFSYCEFGAFDKTKVIRRIVKKEKVNSKKCYFVGDLPSDMRHGKKAEVITIAFLNGHIPKDLVLETKPDFTINNFKEIVGIIKKRS